MATDLATLAIRVENGDVIKTTTSLNSMEVAGTKAEASTTRLTRRMALLEIQARQMDTALAKSQSTTGKLVSAMGLTEEAAAKLGHAFGALSAVAAVGFLGHKLVEETIAAQNAMAQLEAAVLATGGSAGRTVAQMDELSLALQKQTTFSDEAVKGAEAILLTFNKIKGDNLDRATVAVTNLATRLGKDLPEAALQVGKALQDPVEGLNALTRLGIRLSQSQKDAIQDLVDTGHAAQAQGVILKELEGRYVGAAEAARNTLGGALKGLANDFGDLFEVSKGGTSGVVDAIHGLDSAVRTLGQNMGAVVTAGELVASVFAGRMVAGLAKAAQAQADVASAALGAGTIQREAAASAIATATAQQASAARVIAALQAEAAEVGRLIVLERERAAVARASAASVAFQITPTNTGATGPAADFYGRKQQEAQLTAATAARTAALEAEATAIAAEEALEQRRAGILVQAAAVEISATEATVARTVAVAREGEVIAATSLVAQAGAAATGLFGKAITALGGPISAAIIAAVAINAALDAYGDHLLKAAEQTDSQREATERALATAHARAAAQKKETDELSEAARKFAALSEQRTTELGKLTALNGAYRESAVALAILGIRYDAQIQKSEDAKEHHGRELAALNALTDSITRQKVAQVLLNDELDREKRLLDAQTENRQAVRTAQHAVTLAGLPPGERDDRQIELKRIDEISDADAEYREKIKRETTEQAALELRIHNERVGRANLVAGLEQEALDRSRKLATELSVGITTRDTEAQTAGLRAMIAAELEGGKAVEAMRVHLAGNEAVQRAVNDATARGTTITDEQAAALRRTAEEYERVSIAAEKLRAIQQEVAGAVNQFLTDAFDKKNPLPNLGKRIRDEIIAGVSQPITAKITATIAHVLGLDEQLSKQEKAAKDMNVAADKMLKAANIYSGQDTPDIPTPGSTTDPRVDAIRKYGKQIAGVAGAGLGGYGVGYGIGQATGSGTLGAIGGAVTGAKLGAAFGPPGMVVGALAGFAGGIIGAGDAAKEAAAKIEAAKKSFKNSWDAIIAEINGDDLAQAVANAHARFQDLGQQYADTLTVWEIIHGKLASGLEDIKKVEDEYVAKLKEEAAAKAHYFDESLDVRILRAQGKTKEADAMEFRNQQEQERDEFKRTHNMVDDPTTTADDATIAQNIADYNKLLYAQSLELQANTKALTDLTTSVRGGPSGFKLAGYIQEYATGRPYPGQWQVPPNPFVPPTSPLSPPMLPPGLTPPSGPQLSQSSTGKVATGSVTVEKVELHLTVTGSETPELTGKRIAKSFLSELDATKNAAFGLNGTRAQALERM